MVNKRGSGMQLANFPIWDSSNRKSLLTNGLAVTVSKDHTYQTAPLAKPCFLHFFFQKY